MAKSSKTRKKNDDITDEELEELDELEDEDVDDLDEDEDEEETDEPEDEEDEDDEEEDEDDEEDEEDEDEDEEEEEAPKAKSKSKSKTKSKSDKSTKSDKPKQSRSRTTDGKVGTQELAEAAGVDARTVRMYLRKHSVPKDPEVGRYEWPSTSNKEFVKLAKAIKEGGGKRVKKESLDKLKGQGKKTGAARSKKRKASK